MSEATDKECIQRCLRGNTDAFSQLVERYQRQVFSIAYGMTHNYNDAEDITQSVFLKVYENLGSYKQKYKFFSWIYRIAVNETLNFIEKERHTETLQEGNGASDQSPADVYEEKEKNRILHQAVDSLSIPYRMVIVLKYFNQLPYIDIAYIMDIPVKKVKSRLFSARQMVRDYIMERGYPRYVE